MTHELTRRQALRAVGTAGVLAAVGSVPAAGQASGEWPQRGADAANTNHNPETEGPRSAPAAESLATVDGEVTSPPVIADGRLFVQQGLGTLSVASGSGRRRWSRFTDDRTSGGVPVAAAHGQVYVLTPSGSVAAMDADTGDTRWRHGRRGIPAVAVTDDRVYVAVGRTVTATAPDGTQQWQRDAPARVRGVGADGDTLHLVTESGLLALGATDSETEWERRIDVGATPVVAGGRVYVRERAAGRPLLALDAASGDQLWRADGLPAPVTTPPAATGDRVYVGAGEDSLGETFFALDAGTGDIVWRTQLGDPTSASASPARNRPAVTAETVFVVSADDTVNAVDAASGEILWREPLGRSLGSPVPANGRLYLTAANEILVFTEASSGSDEGSDSESGTSDSGDTDEQSDSEGDSAGANASETDGNGQSGDDSGAGFGVVGALAGVGGAYLLGRRREDQV